MPAASAIITTATLPITDTGEAIIERVDVRILETNPVQIEAVIRGQLPDSCSLIQDAGVGVVGNVFNIRLTTARQLNQRCIQVFTPFEQIVRLGSPEPAAGTYEVHVGQVVESFTLGE
jgi:inhibitor of cysteine peptidase